MARGNGGSVRSRLKMANEREKEGTRGSEEERGSVEARGDSRHIAPRPAARKFGEGLLACGPTTFPPHPISSYENLIRLPVSPWSTLSACAFISTAPDHRPRLRINCPNSQPALPLQWGKPPFQTRKKEPCPPCVSPFVQPTYFQVLTIQ